MKELKMGLIRAAVMAAFFVACHGFAQTVQISDTLYYANGVRASGRIVVSWTAFTAADATTIAGGNVTAPISTAGVVNLSLYANVGATPSGTSYQARYFLSNGTAYTETWVVPASGPVTIAGVRVNTIPTPTVLVSPTQLRASNSPTDEFCYTYEATGATGQWQTCGVGGGGANFIFEEGPAGTLNGVNVTFTLNNAPLPGSLQLVYNGLVLHSGAGNDFTVSGTTITMNYAPVAGSNFVAWYQY